MQALDLKVCEGCGGLWVRPKDNKGVYCRHCVKELTPAEVKKS